MAHISYRANVQTRLFPLLAQLQGQTVIIPERDQTYVPNVNPQDQDVPVDRGIPQIIYGHNVMPSTYGIQSIGYRSRRNGLAGVQHFDEIELVERTVANNSTYIAFNRQTTDSIFVYRNDTGTWVRPTGRPTNIAANAFISTATLAGRTYICIAGRGVYTLSTGSGAPTMNKVTLKGLSDGNVRGILGAMGYMITWSNTGIAWSSASDILDFVPDEVTGAGSAGVEDAAGNIVWCQSTSYGFILYTTGNSVQSTWSGNTAFPWKLRGIPSSGGIANKFLVSKESNGQHFVYTSNGLQQIYHTGAKTFMPAVTDFLSGRLMDDLNPATGAITVSTSPGELRKRVSYVSDRYLVLSYGMSNQTDYTHAIVIDTGQNRIGKLKWNHRQVFSFQGNNEPRDSLALMNSQGAIHTVNFRLNDASRNGVLLLGKYQAARGYMTQMLKLALDNEDPALANMRLKVLPSADGSNFQAPVEGFLSEHTAQFREYLFSHYAKSHGVLLDGAFNLISLEMQLNVEGVIR